MHEKTIQDASYFQLGGIAISMLQEETWSQRDIDPPPAPKNMHIMHDLQKIKYAQFPFLYCKWKKKRIRGLLGHIF